MKEDKIKTYLNLLFGSVIITILGFVADLTTIFSNTFAQNFLKSDLVKFIPYLLLVVATALLLHLNRLVKNNREELNKAYIINNQLWKRIIRTLRSIIIADIPTPHIKEALDPILDELVRRFPENGSEVKISIAKPLEDGCFKIIASRGTDPTSVFLLESRSNWKQKKSFFSNALYLDEDHPYCKYKSGGGNYENIQRPQGVGTAKFHLAITIKNNQYDAAVFPQNCLAIISFGMPKIYNYEDFDEESFYNKIYPIISSIEAILLLNQKNLLRNVY